MESSDSKKTQNLTPTFFCAILFSFFALSTTLPRQFSSPISCLSVTSDLLFLVEKRQPQGLGLGTVLDGVNKRKSFLEIKAKRNNIISELIPF